MSTKEAKALFSQGRQSRRRTLTAAQARRMVGVRLTKSAFRKYFTLCFWSCEPTFPINRGNADWVVAQLQKNGNLAAWKRATRIKAFLNCPVPERRVTEPVSVPPPKPKRTSHRKLGA